MRQVRLCRPKYLREGREDREGGSSAFPVVAVRKRLLTKLACGGKFLVAMARKLQYADWVREYEVPEPASVMPTYRIQVEKGSSGGSPDKVSRIRKKGRQKKKSTK